MASIRQILKRGHAASVAAGVPAIAAFMLCFPAVVLWFAPTRPIFPAANLDASWQWAMSYAAAHGMAFGRDIIFTYGPYADLSDRPYDPALRIMLLAAPALVATSYAVGLAALDRKAAAILIAAVLPLIYDNDILIFTMSAPAMLACANAIRGTTARSLPLAVLLLAPTLALPPLIKLSFLPISLVGLAVIAWLLIVAGHRQLALFTLLGFAVAVPLLWLASGQDLRMLPAYFGNGSAIIAGYASAMAVFGPLSDIAVGLTLALLIMVLVAIGARRLPRRASVPLLLSATRWSRMRR